LTIPLIPIRIKPRDKWEDYSMKKLISTVLCLLILLSCILPAMAATGVPEEVMESTKSVVRILSKYYNGAATGSGFVIKNEPGEVLIATNDHVVEGNPTSISIWVGEDRMVDAEIVFTTSEKDLCVLKVTDDVDMKPLKLSKEEPQHGAAIYVVGYPGAGDILSDTQAHTSESVTITDGIISAIRSFTIEKGGNPVKLLQVNAAINSGNSGGPLFNTEGVVVGVNTYKVNADSQGVFGSVDISELWSLLDQYGIEISEEPAVVEAEEKEVVEETSFLMPALICAGVVCLVLTVILIAKRRKKNTPQRKRKDPKIQTITLQAHMEKYPQGLGVGGSVSLLLSAAIQLRNFHNDGKLHLQICPENILIGADGASLKEPSSQETGRFNSGFAAPEIYRGAGFGITSDIYSFAAVLLYATTGKVPANSLQQDALEQDFSLLDDVIFAQITRKAMASNILDRTQSMQELIYSIAVYNAPVQERQSQPLRTVETVPVSISEERPAPAPVKEEQVKIPKHRKKTVPKKKHRKLLPIAAVLVCGIVAVVLLLKPAAKQDGSVELQSTEQTEIDDFSEEEIQYQKAKKWEADGQLGRAAIAFGKLGDYSDARQRSFALWNRIQRDTVSTGNYHTVGVKADGTVAAVGRNDEGQCNVEDWTDIVAVSAGYLHTVGLKADGTVVAVGQNAYGQRNAVEGWENIVGVSTGTQHTVGLKVDGTIVAVGRDDEGQCNVEDWTDIIAVNAGDWHTVGLKTDGTVIAVGSNDEGQCNVEDWTDIVAISAGAEHTVGLKADGTVVAVGYNSIDASGYYRQGQCNVEDWTDIVAVSAGAEHTVGLKSDGTIVAVGQNTYGQCNVEDWMNIVAIGAGYWHTVGLKADGTIVSFGYNGDGQCNVSELENICVPAERLPARNGNETKPEEPPTDQQAQYDAAEKLLASGETAKAAIAFGKLAGYEDARQRSFSLWNTLIKRESVYCINGYFYGLKNDGSVVTAGKDEFGISTNSDWKNVLQLVGGSKFGNLYQNDTCLLGLRSDGTVITAGQNEAGQCNVSDWTNVVKLWHQGARFYDSSKTNGFWRYDYHNYVGMTVGLRADGTVVTTGSLEEVFDVSGWTDIVDLELSCSWDQQENTLIGGLLVGVRSDGTVVFTGDVIEDWMEEMKTWTNIVDVCLGRVIVGLRSDGTVVYASDNNSQFEYMKTWKNVSALINIRTALSDDGNLLSNTHAPRGSMKDQWNNLVYVNDRADIGLKADGTVVVDAFDSAPNGNVRNWTDVVAVSGWSANHGGHTIGIRSDGTVLAVGDTKYISEVATWTNIRIPAHAKSPVRPAAIGVTVQTVDESAPLPAGAWVVSVDKNHAAERAGIQPKDIILRLEEYEITDVTDLTRALRNFYAGDTAEIVVSRSGEEITLKITFDAK